MVGQRGRKDALGLGGKLSRVRGSSTPNCNVDILLTVLHASIGSLSLSIIISASAYLVLLPRLFMLSRKATSGESSFVLWTALSTIVPDYGSDVKASPVYENLLGFSMHESERVRDSQISHFTNSSITQTPDSVKGVV